MNSPSYTSSLASLLITLYIAFFASAVFANSSLPKPLDRDDSIDQAASGPIFTAEMRWTIKREVMSKPGVMLDMANMTDNGYIWINDVVWAGSNAGSVEASDKPAATKVAGVTYPWYIAGFMFQRPGYKDVWLQYAFTLSNATGEIADFRRWYGNESFR